MLYLFSRYNKYRNKQIQIVKDSDTFRFGNIDDLQQYDKLNVEYVKIYAPKDKKIRTVKYALFEIVFKDESKIELSTILIPIKIFLDTFSKQEIKLIDTAFPFM